MALEKLKRIKGTKLADGTQITRFPNNEEMMGKINEIIDFVNHLEKNKESKPINRNSWFEQK